jgi:peptidoglycan/LPS O-acetylase OafA/YrhL
MSDAKRLVALLLLTIFLGAILLLLIFYGPEHPNPTQQSAINTLLVICSAAGLVLIKGFQNLLSSRRGPQRKQSR